MEEKVRTGEKRQTIRPVDAYRHLKVGDRIHAYSTKHVDGSRRPVTDELLYEGRIFRIIIVDWKFIRDCDTIAKFDGFESAKEMRKWFEEKYGKIDDNSLWRIIRWENLEDEKGDVK